METQEIELLLNKDEGLFEQLFGLFQGNRKGWNIFGMLLSIIIAILMVFSGYHFVLSETVDDRVFWGVLFIAFLTGTMAIKMWFWLEMNRNSTHREIKRLELAIAQLTAKTGSQLK